VTSLPATAQEPTVQRKILLTHDLAIPGYQTVMGAVEIPPGGREGRHTHPGAVVVYIQEGVLTFDYDGWWHLKPIFLGVADATGRANLAGRPGLRTPQRACSLKRSASPPERMSPE
jgi:hypothetical protein